MDNPGEILRLCRLCLVKDQVNIPIFEEQGDIRQIFLKISSCLPVKVSRDDKLPKKICDGCSNKLDLLYEFWNTSANAEKTLLSWLGQAGVKDADETISAVAQQIAKPAETQVKQEALEDGHATSQVQDNFGVQSFDEDAKDESEAPPPKRARRTAAVKAQINITPESDDDDDMDSAEAMTKVEDESDESDGEEKDPSYSEVPGTSADDQAGPSGVGKDGVEAPFLIKLENPMLNTNVNNTIYINFFDPSLFYKRRVPLITNFPCSICKKPFPSEYRLKIHMEIHREDRPFNCTLCLKTFKTCPPFKRHMKEHNKEYKAECKQCNMKFMTPGLLNSHRNSVHHGGLLCSECGKIYRSQNSFVTHVKEHDPNFQQDPVKCNYCDKKFSKVIYMKRHMVRCDQNKERQSFVCDTCGKIFYCKWDLDIHLKMHTGVKKMECDVCHKRFFRLYTLKMHKLTHTGEKPFRCKYCEKCYSQPGPLKIHKKREHSKENSF